MTTVLSVTNPTKESKPMWNKIPRRRLRPEELPREYQSIWVACNNGEVYLTRFVEGRISAFHFDGRIKATHWTAAVPPTHPGLKRATKADYVREELKS